MPPVSMYRIPALLLIILVSGCSTNSDTKSLVITGSSTVAPVMSEIASDFENEHPGIRIEIQTGGSSRGVADVKNGKADFGMISRQLKNSEGELNVFKIANDGIGLIVHSSNPVEGLTTAQIRSAFTGKTKRWSDVGGPDQELVVCSKAEGRGTLEVFLNHFDLKPANIQASLIVGDNQHSIKTVSGNPAALAYVSIGAAEYAIKNGEPIKLIRLDGVMPSTETVRDGSYTMTRPLNLIFQGDLSPIQMAFVKSTGNKSSRQLIRSQYFVPVVDESGTQEQ